MSPSLEQQKSTTTLSTIVLKSGECRIVIALLKSGLQMRIEVVEIEPNLAHLGETFEEAAQLQSSHLDVLRQLQSKQSPVEDLLRQADELIVNQKPKAGVYAAMAESLGAAWQDLHGILDQRRAILDKNFLFKGHLQDYFEKADSFRQSILRARSSQKNANSLMSELLKSKKKMLEASVFALQEGDGLLNTLNQAWLTTGQCVASKDIRFALSRSIEQVEQWMETIYEKRLKITKSFEDMAAEFRKSSEQQEHLDQLECMESLVAKKHNHLESRMCELGASSSNVNSMIEETLQLITEAKTISEKCLEFTMMNFAQRAYDLMESITQYQQRLDSRLETLQEAKAIFDACREATNKLNEIESKLENLDLKTDSSQKLESIANVTHEIITDIYDRGLRLIEKSGSGGGAQHLKAEIVQLHAKGNNLKTAISLKQAQANRHSASWKNFQSKLGEIDNWLTHNLHLGSCPNMGSTLEQAMQFSAFCKDLMSSVQLKIYELEGMKGAFKIMTDQNTDAAARDEVEGSLASVQQQILTALTQIEETHGHSAKYVKLLKLTKDLSQQMQSLEDQLLVIKSKNATQTTKHQYEVQRLSIQQLFLQVCNFSKNLLRELNEDKSGMIDKEAVAKNISAVMEDINRKQKILIDIWNIISTQKNEDEAVDKEVQQAINLANNMLGQANIIEENVYPLINADDEPTVIVASLEKSYASMSKMRILAESLSQLEANISQMTNKTAAAEELRKINNALKSGAGSLKEKVARLESLLQILITFVKRVAEAKMTIKELLTRYQSPIRPSCSNVWEIETQAQEHEASKKSMTAKFQELKEQAQKAQHETTQFDLKVIGGNSSLYDLVNTLEREFLRAWQDRKTALTKQAKLCLQGDNLNSLNAKISDLTQLLDIKTTLEESRNSLTLAAAFLDTFESSQLPQLRNEVHECLIQGEHLEAELPELKATISVGRGQCQDKLRHLEALFEQRKAKLLSAKEYFDMQQEFATFLRDANRNLLGLSRKAAESKTTKDNESIKAELEAFISDNKKTMTGKVSRLGTLAHETFGTMVFSSMKCVQEEIESTFDSATKFLIDLSNKIAEIKTSEVEAVKQAQYQVEAEAHIRAAKAEAEAAKLAAKTADEERKAAIYQHSTLCQQSSVSYYSTFESEQPPPRPPPPAPISPVFKECLKDVVLMEGERCSLKARVSGDPTPKITWFKDGVPVHNNPDYKAFFDETSGICELLIEETFVADSANWSVRASNIGGYAESHAKLTVKEPKPSPPKGAPPTLIAPLKQISVKEGEKAVFICIVEGTPTPKLTWYKNDVYLDNCHFHNYTIQDINGEGKLTIEDAKPRDAAIYFCKASNSFGAVTSSASLVVQPLEPCEPPIFQEPLVNIETTTGSAIRLECQVIGTPKLEITWLQNSRSLPKNIGVETSFVPETGVASLVIMEAFPKASGKYTCRARNNAGEATTTAVVTVKGIPPTEVSDSDAVNETPQVVRPSKPAFYVPLKNMECHAGEEVIFEAVIVSTPAPETVLWYRNNVPVKNSDNFQMKQYGDVFKLIIGEVENSENYAGEYKVRAINVAGECQSTCNLSVKKNQRSSYLRHPCSDESLAETKPAFCKRLVGISCDAGDTVKLEAVVEGKPRPTIQWFKDDQLLQSNPPWLIIEQNESKCSLIIHQAEEGKATGSYKVLAINCRGSVESQADIEVRPPPPRPPLPSTSPLPPRRPPSPRQCRSSPLKLISTVISESATLKTLSQFGRNERPLPHLEPFPFKPDEGPHPRGGRRKILGKVPKPSKFCKGEMYFSDYDSDWGDTSPIRAKWRPYHSDAEDLEPAPEFRSVKPYLKSGNAVRSVERCPSPPCPHQWESHEDVERLEKELRSRRHNNHVLNPSTRTSRIETSSVQQCSSLKIWSSSSSSSCATSNMVTVLGAEKPLTTISPSTLSNPQFNRQLAASTSDDYACSTQSTLAVKRGSKTSEFVSVKEKAKLLEQQLENLEDESSEKGDHPSRSGSAIKPEEIPGAVRVLPPAIRGCSTSRSASADLFGVTSPVPRSWQNSPMTLPRTIKTNEPLNRSSEWPSLDGRSKSISVTVEKLQTRQNFQKQEEPSPFRDQKTTSLQHHSVEIRHSYSSDLGFFSMPDEEKDVPPTIELKAFRTNETSGERSKTPPLTAARKQDGYEADTDDTLSRCRKSVKDLAKSFNQAATQNGSSPRLFFQSGDESDKCGSLQRNLGGSGQQPSFIASPAYVPPKWALSNEQNKKAPVVFKPTKFVPGGGDSWSKVNDDSLKIPPTWKPSTIA